MLETDIYKKIADEFPKIELKWVAAEKGDSFLRVPAESLVDVINFLRNTWELSFDSLMSLCGVDMKDSIDVVYHLYSYRHKHRFVV
jgi:NADH:ubiquinone oxidoreductase subunit C